MRGNELHRFTDHVENIIVDYIDHIEFPALLGRDSKTVSRRKTCFGVLPLNYYDVKVMSIIQHVPYRLLCTSVDIKSITISLIDCLHMHFFINQCSSGGRFGRCENCVKLGGKGR